MKKLLWFPLIAILISLFSCQPQSAKTTADKSIAFIGSYTQNEGHVDGKGIGISVYETGSTSEDWKLLGSFSDIINPTFLCLSPTLPIVYAVSEQGPAVPGPKSIIKVIQYDPESFAMTEVQQISALGDGPCHISMDRKGQFLFVANYGSGNVVQYAINADGKLQSGQSHQHIGSGPDNRQRSPHAHFIQQHPITDDVYAVNLGTDQVIRYQANENGLQQLYRIQTEPGAGPRHMVWNANGEVAYILNELTGTIECWTWNNSSARRLQIVALNPEPTKYFAGSADIHISKDNRFIYASLRGNFNEVVVLSIDPETFNLTLIQRVPVGGEVPRNFALSPKEDYLAVALQNSDLITLFDRDPDSGLLSKPPSKVAVKTPVCVVYKTNMSRTQSQ